MNLQEISEVKRSVGKNLQQGSSGDSLLKIVKESEKELTLKGRSLTNSMIVDFFQKSIRDYTGAS